ncbi:TPA: ATP-binding protein, partial [Clostridioides difficile]
YISIKDIVTVEGRMTKRQLAWDVFKEAIRELEKKENDFETIIVDLLEDTYEACRLYMYDKMGITHESDDSFRAWDKVRTEFLSTIKRLMNLDYKNIILISHEDTSKDITKKGGDKITAIKPNLQEKAANKIAGMVDIVARVVADGDVRTLSFKTNEVIFGGGRLKVKSNEIPLDYNELMKVYEDISIEKKEIKKSSKPKKSKTNEEVEMTPIVEETSEKTEKEQTEEEVIEQEEAIKPVKKTRKKRS